MFEGIHQILIKDTIKGGFVGNLEIQNLNEAVFTYDIVVHKKDAFGKMIELKPNSEFVKLNQTKVIENGGRYVWIGQNRTTNYLKSEES